MPWPTKKLTDVCDLQRGTEPGSAFYVEMSDKAIPFLRVGDLTGKVDAPKFVKSHNSNLQVVNENETLITFDGTPGIVVRGFEGSIASGIRVVKSIKPEVDGNFLFYYLRTPYVQKTIKSYSKGATIIHASSAIEHIKIPLPPLEIQKQIVERMDKIAEARKLNDELIQKTDELYRSLLHNELNVKFKNQNAKSQFKIKKLEEVCEINPSKAEINKLPENTVVSFLAMADVSENAEILNRQERKLSEVKSGFTFFKNGDVLVAKITPCFENGKGAFIENMKNGVGFGSTEFHVLRANREVLLNQFLYHFVSDKNFRKVGAKFMTGSAGQQRVPTHYVENFKIPLPPIETQKQIVAKLSAVQDYKKQLLGQKAKLKELFDSALAKSMTSEKKSKDA